MPFAAGVVLAKGGERAKQKHSRDDKGPVHPKSPLSSKLSGITPERDDFRRFVIPLWLIAGERCFPNTGAKPIKSEQTVSGPCSVATHAPANDDEQIPVLVPQAPGEEITVSLLATTASLGYALADPLAQAPAPAPIILPFLSVSPVADPLAEATP
jgi:hypothetical protein